MRSIVENIVEVPSILNGNDEQVPRVDLLTGILKHHRRLKNLRNFIKENLNTEVRTLKSPFGVGDC